MNINIFNRILQYIFDKKLEMTHFFERKNYNFVNISTFLNYCTHFEYKYNQRKVVYNLQNFY